MFASCPEKARPQRFHRLLSHAWRRHFHLALHAGSQHFLPEVFNELPMPGADTFSRKLFTHLPMPSTSTSPGSLRSPSRPAETLFPEAVTFPPDFLFPFLPMPGVAALRPSARHPHPLSPQQLSGPRSRVPTFLPAPSQALRWPKTRARGSLNESGGAERCGHVS